MEVSQDIFSEAFRYVQAREEDRQVLGRLCAASEAALRSRLRPDISPEDCYDSFVCAAALMAAADFSAVSAGVGVRSFTAGPVSVSREDAAFSRSLREQAAILMAPWCRDAFRFLEVEG